MSALRATDPAYAPPLAANDNAALSVRAKINLRLTAQRPIDSKDRLPRHAYDARAKVTSITDGAVSGNNRSFGYDSLGRLTSATGPWGSGVNTYDMVNNLLTRTLGSRTITLNYNYDKNRVNQSVDSGATGTRTVAYDLRGNSCISRKRELHQTTLGTLGMVYDHSDQPTIITGSVNGTSFNSSSFTYDGNLKRVKSVINGRTIYNVYDASGGLAHVHELAASGQPDTRTDYVKLGGMAIARVENKTTPIYSYSDHLGSPVTSINGATGIIERERYTPFGIAMDNPATLKDQAGFTGHIKDSATGLNYMQARYYDPVMGRFLSIDPVTFIGSGMNPGMFNRYSYTMNDPINLIDPDGRACTKTTGSNICNRNYKTKIKSGRQAEKAERNHFRTNDKERVTSGRVSASYTKDDSYKRGREYDIVSQTKDGHYNLTEVKYRKTKDTKVKSGVKPLEGGKLGWRAYQGLVTARQVSFDLNAAGEDLTLSGKGIPGGEITLSPDQYTITWVLANQHGKAIGANINDGSGGIQEVLDNFVTPD